MHMNYLTPYLMFNGTCEEAMHFYKEVLDGEIVYLGRYSEGPIKVDQAYEDKIMHAELVFWGGKIMASDFVKGVGFKHQTEGSNVHLNLVFNDEAKMLKTFNLLANEGKVILPVEKAFWDAKFGMLTDKYGMHWILNCAAEK